jgi:hypothetical protein
MLMPFTARSRLLRAVKHLAIYNDKGISWSNHTQEQAQAERAMSIAKIKALVVEVGEANLPSEFIGSLKSGELATDLTGKFTDVLKSYFRR